MLLYVSMLNRFVRVKGESKDRIYKVLKKIEKEYLIIQVKDYETKTYLLHSDLLEPLSNEESQSLERDIKSFYESIMSYERNTFITTTTLEKIMEYLWRLLVR